MSAETAVYLVAGAVDLMVLVVALIAAMVVLDGLAAWPPRPRHRRPATRKATPGAQYYVRSTQTTTAAIAISEGRWTR
jgi:hypothetical protein